MYKKIILSNKSSQSFLTERKKRKRIRFALFYQDLSGWGWLLEIDIFNAMV